MADDSVCVIYDEDGGDWAEYIKRELFDLKINSHIINFQHEIPEPTKTSLEQIGASPAVIVIMSPMLMQGLRNGSSLTNLIQDSKNGLVIMLGTEVQSFEEANLSQMFPDYRDKWKVLEYDDEWKKIEIEVTKIYDSYKQREARLKKDEVDSGATAASFKNNKKKIKNEMTLIPSKARCEERTEVALSFEQEVKHDAIEVFLESKTDHSEVMHITKVTKLNPYTFAIIAPEHSAGKMLIKAMVTIPKTDTESGPQFTCIASAHFEYYNTMSAVDGINQILLNACNAAYLPLQDMRYRQELNNIDSKLCKLLFDYDHNQIPTSGFELLFGQYEFTETETSPEEVPTLLHLAAKFGLRDLTKKLLDLPGSAYAVSITNRDGKHPSEIAMKYGHNDLADDLKRFHEEDNNDYQVYTSFAGYGSLSNVPNCVRKYYNAIARTGRGEIEPVNYMEKEEYLCMVEADHDRRDSSDDDYYTVTTPAPRRQHTKRHNTLPSHLVTDDKPGHPRPVRRKSTSTKTHHQPPLNSVSEHAHATEEVAPPRPARNPVPSDNNPKMRDMQECQKFLLEQQEGKKKKGTLPKKGKWTPKPSPQTQRFVREENGVNRDSSSSSGSRNSTDGSPLRGGRGRGNRHSFVEESLAKTPTEPPPIPPRGYNQPSKGPKAAPRKK